MSRTAAVIDVGSNTVRLVTARCSGAHLDELHTERVRLGLGHELEAAGRLDEESIAEAAEAVRAYCEEARRQGAHSLDVLVTAPGRQAENGDELVVALTRAARHPVRVLTADEEAELSFAGAVALAEPEASVVAVVDLGGASTEIAVGRPETGPAWKRSVDLGALRLTTRLQELDGDVDAARAAVAEAFAGVTPPVPGAALIVGGSARALGRVAGDRLGPEELAEAVAVLEGLSPEEIGERFDVGKHRAPLVLAAALIVAEVQQRLLVPLEVCEGGLREGALLVALDEAAA